MSKHEEAKDEIIALLREENRLLKAKIDHLIRVIYGSKSEKLDASQLELLLDPEAAKKQEAADGSEDHLAANIQELKSPPQDRKDRNPRLPENIPTVEQVIVPDEVKANPEQYRQIGQEQSEKLDVEPARYTRILITRPTFIKKDEIIPKLLTAPAPPSVLAGSILTPSLLSHVITLKYCDHQPLYRQEQIMTRRHDINIPRNTLCHWVNIAAETLEPLSKLIAKELRCGSHLKIDETPIAYLAPGTGSTKQGYLWVYENPASGIYYDWQSSRSHGCLDKILTDENASFTGTLQCDGYKAYETWAAKQSNSIVLAGCWAHVRRKFYEAHKETPKLCVPILQLIQQLYQNEQRVKERPPDQRLFYRRRYSKPILKHIKKLLHQHRTQYLPKSTVGKAITYTLGQWKKLETFLQYGEVDIDNNSVERAIRPTKLGAKNWLFIGNDEAGWRSAVIYTMIENVRRIGKDPYAYLKWVFEKIPTMSNQNDLRALLPKSWVATATENKLELPRATSQAS